MGIHGETGVRRQKMIPADKLVTELVDLLLRGTWACGPAMKSAWW